MKGGFFKKNLKMLAQNQIVLYILVVLAIMNLVGYLVRDNLAAIVLFLMVGYSATYLTKNMIYVLLFSILITNFLVKMGIMKNLGLREGMTDGSDDEVDGEVDGEGEGDGDESDESDESDHVSGTAKEAVKAGVKKGARAMLEVIAEPNNEKKSSTISGGADSSNGKKQKTGFSNIKDKAMILNKPKPVLAKTVEAAYDNLSNILGSDSLKLMEKDTSRLASKQKMLVDQIKKMEPLMKNATDILKNFNIGSLDGISDIINKLGSK